MTMHNERLTKDLRSNDPMSGSPERINPAKLNTGCRAPYLSGAR